MHTDRNLISQQHANIVRKKKKRDGLPSKSVSGRVTLGQNHPKKPLAASAGAKRSMASGLCVGAWVREREEVRESEREDARRGENFLCLHARMRGCMRVHARVHARGCVCACAWMRVHARTRNRERARRSNWSPPFSSDKGRLRSREHT